MSYTFPNQQAYLDAKSGLKPFGYTTFSQTIGTPDFDMNNSLASWFVQDDFKLKANFKILYGVRHDMYLYTHGIEGSPYSQTFNRDMNNLAPRVGFAWTLNPKTVIRGSSGINYDQPLLAIIEGAYTSRVWPREPRASTSRRRVRSRPRSPATSAASRRRSCRSRARSKEWPQTSSRPRRGRTTSRLSASSAATTRCRWGATVARV